MRWAFWLRRAYADDADAMPGQGGSRPRPLSRRNTNVFSLCRRIQKPGQLYTLREEGSLISLSDVAAAAVASWS